MTHRLRGNSREMPKKPESLDWRQHGLFRLPFYIVTRLGYWPPRRVEGGKRYKTVDKGT